MSVQKTHNYFTQIPVLKELAPMWKAGPARGRFSGRWWRWRPMRDVYSLCTSRDKQVPGHAPSSDFCAVMGRLENAQLCKQSFTTSQHRDQNKGRAKVKRQRTGRNQEKKSYNWKEHQTK